MSCPTQQELSAIVIKHHTECLLTDIAVLRQQSAAAQDLARTILAFKAGGFDTSRARLVAFIRDIKAQAAALIILD